MSRIDTSMADAFRRAVITNKLDDAPRLIYCDWLEEYGLSNLAEFIRWQVANPESRYEYGRTVHTDARFVCGPHEHLAWFSRHAEQAIGSSVGYYSWTRGFVSHISDVSATDWLDRCDDLTAKYPLEKVELASRLQVTRHRFVGSDGSEHGYLRFNGSGKQRNSRKTYLLESVNHLSEADLFQVACEDEWPGIEIVQPVRPGLVRFPLPITHRNFRYTARDHETMVEAGRRWAEEIERRTLDRFIEGTR